MKWQAKNGANLSLADAVWSKWVYVLTQSADLYYITISCFSMLEEAPVDTKGAGEKLEEAPVARRGAGEKLEEASVARRGAGEDNGGGMTVNPNEEVKMTYTSVLSKNGRPHISLMFERGKDSCEASIPECVVTKNNGFSADETEALEKYLVMNKKQIIDQARGISGFGHMFGDVGK